MAQDVRLGFIGLGDIGFPMARRLLQSGASLTVWNRSPEKAAPLAAEGVRVANTPAEVMANSDIVGLCLTSHQAVEEVAFGPNGLTSSDVFAGKIVVDFSTGSPKEAQRFADKARSMGFGWIDSPVSGGVPGAEKGSLIIFAGGDAAQIEAANPMLAPLSARVNHMGASGAGQVTKLCSQMIVSTNAVLMAEMIAAARRAGVDVERLPAALRGGWGDSTPLQIFGPRMASHVFTPRLGAVGVMEKDVKLARKMALDAGADMPMLSLAAELYAQVCRDLDPEADLSTLIGLFEPLDRPV